MAINDEEPVAWTRNGPPVPERYWDALEDPETLIYAHHAHMEAAMCQALIWKTWGVMCPALSRFRCTISLANRACLPVKLETLGEVLGLDAKKDNRGKALIKKFSIMQPAKKPTKKNPAGVPAHRIMPEDDPAAFAEFVEYCRQDVRAEQGVARKLAYFDTALNNSNFSLTLAINARGVPVNLDALRHAQKLVEEETEIVSAKFRELVGFEVTQGAKILAWLHEQDCPLSDLQAETVETYLEQEEGKYGEPGIAETALRLRASINYAAIKKIPTMLACAGPHDNRIRGMLNHHGAGTGRWTASLVQFQNMKRPAKEMSAETYKGSGITWSEVAYREICAGVSLEMLRCCFGDPLEVISSCIRHFVHDV